MGFWKSKRYHQALAGIIITSSLLSTSSAALAAGTDTYPVVQSIQEDHVEQQSRLLQADGIALCSAEEGVSTFEAVQRTEKEMLSVYADLDNRIKATLLAGDTVVDITDLKLNEKLNPLYYFFAYSPYFPEGLNLTFWTDAESNYLEVSLENPLTVNQTSIYFQQVDTRLAFYQSLISDGMSEAEKALTIHDYLVTHTEYDLNYTKYEARDVFMNGNGTCQAYAMAYDYIMNSLGIDAYFSGVPGRGHCWSVLQIDGELYNVDCAFDDFYDNHELQIAQIGMASHKHFLQSDAGLTVSGYTGSQTDRYVCSSDRFADAYWTDVTSPVAICADRAYFIVNNTLIKRYNETGFTRELAAIQNERGIGHSGLVLNGDMLYYNSDTEIHRFSLTDEGNQLVYRGESNTDLLNGCVLKPDGIKVAVTQHPTEVGPIFSLNDLTTDGWHELKSGQKMYYENHMPVMNQWRTISGKQYYFDTNGYWDQTKKNEWEKDSKGWWYRHANGTYTRNDWELIDGKWYHFDNSGYMETSKWIGNYYVKADGTMAKSEWVDGNKYYVDANGVWDKTKQPAKWIKDGSKWWYRHTDGSYTRNNWEYINGAWYHFDNSGYMETNKWIGDYYVKSDGRMATNCWVGKYYVGADGKWKR